MSKFLYGFVAATTMFIIVGCSSLLNNNQGILGKAQKSNDQVQTQIRNTENQQAQSNEDKLRHISAYSVGGVEYSLNQIKTNIPQEVIVARKMNDRIEALSGPSDFDEVQGIKGIVDDLLSQVQQTRIDGQKALALKDKEIADIQQQDQQLDTQRETEISVAMQQSDANAAKADQYQATLKQMDSYFGLGAVFYGLKKFIVSWIWILAIGGAIFLILRLLASSNPIAAAIFSVFDQIGSWFVSTISVIFPKAVSLAGNVATTVYTDTKSALTSLVDSVETVKLQSTASGQPATIEDLLNTAEVSMTASDKALIEQIKLELGWVKPTTAPATVPLTTTTTTTIKSVATSGSTTGSATVSIPVLTTLTGSLPTTGSVA